MVEQVSDTLKQADQMAAGYAQGKVGLTDAVLASEKADTTFQVDDGDSQPCALRVPGNHEPAGLRTSESDDAAVAEIL